MTALLLGGGCAGNVTVRATPTTVPATSVTGALPAERPPTMPKDTAPTSVATDPADPGTAADRGFPDVRFDYFDGTEGSLGDFAGTPTVVNFWASWCPPCIVEMPAFEAVHRELRPQVAFLGLNVGDEPAAARRLADRTGVGYPLGEDPAGAIFGAVGGIGMPTTVFVDGDGMIVHMVASRLKAQDLRALIAEHLGV